MTKEILEVLKSIDKTLKQIYKSTVANQEATKENTEEDEFMEFLKKFASELGIENDIKITKITGIR